MTRRVASSAELSSLVALSLWLGASITVAAVVAPAAFAVLPTRTLAGALVGRVLPVLFYAGALVGAVAALLAPRRSYASARVGGATALLVACLTAQLLVAPRIGRARADAGGPIDQLSPGDARRVAFGRLHAVSVALLGAGAVGATVALTFTLRALAGRESDPILNPQHEH